MVNPSVDLVILRHGEAEPYLGSDAERELTSRGQTETKEQMALLHSQGFRPQEIIHSPFVRTSQTAAICQQVFPEAVLRAHSGLLHSAEPNMVPLLLGDADAVLLVSHMPLVARLLQYLCPGETIYGFNVSGYARMNVTLASLTGTLVHDATAGYHDAV